MSHTFDSQVVTVQKLNLRGETVWSYSGIVVEHAPHHVCLEARFNRAAMDLGYTVFEPGDRFVEWFFDDRWYNIFEVHSARDDHIKGWYCNVTKPAALDVAQGSVSAIDLALDMWVGSGGSIVVLDEDEFAALALPEADRRAALAALDELKRLAHDRHPPFDGSGRLESTTDKRMKRG
jgi:hypothetical protein